MTRTLDDVAARRRLEDILLACRQEREWLEHQEMINRGKTRAVLGDARAAGIKMSEIADLTGLSRQTLHAWMNMLPIPEVHYGLAGPHPQSIAESVLRTMGEQPARDWLPDQVRTAIPASWPTADDDVIEQAMESLARTRRIWDGESVGYRIAPPS